MRKWIALGVVVGIIGAGALKIGLAKSVAKTPSPKLPETFVKVPLIPQAHSWSCGAAAMLSIFFYWGVYDGNESSLYPHLRTTSDYGTDPINMEKYARELGLKAEIKLMQTFADLEKGLKRGDTIILDFQAWADATPPIDWENRWEDGHYAILVAMDDHYLYFADPSVLGGHAWIPKPEFMKRWHDYEIRDGLRVENRQLAMYISGKKGMSTMPGAMIRLQ